MGTEALIVNLLLRSRTCSWTHTCLVPNDQHDEKSSKQLVSKRSALPTRGAKRRRSDFEHGDARRHATLARITACGQN